MEPNSPAEELPALYRAILDRVADLEAGGDRLEAAQVRFRATKAYSRAWDDKARNELEALLKRADKPTAAERLKGRGTRRSFGRAVRASAASAVAPDR
jgi:hypothetical protein